MNEHVNMANFIAPKSDQLNSDDLIGGPRTITITRVTANEGNGEQPVNVFYAEDEKHPFRPCKSMRRVMVKIWGADSAKYIGQSMTLYRDPKVKWGGMEVGGIRISHMTGIDAPQTMALTETRAARKPYTVQPLKVEARVDKAAEGAAALIARIDAGEDVVDEPQVKKQRAWLAANRPDLAAQVEAAFAAREPDDDDPFGDAPADETDPTEAKLANIRASIAAAKNEKGLQAVDGEWIKARAAYDDATAEEIDGLIRARKAELAG